MDDSIRRIVKEVLGELKGKNTLIKKPDGVVQRFRKSCKRKDVTKLGRD